jgi:uncharacterized repeat protein (TIGR03837 family)
MDRKPLIDIFCRVLDNYGDAGVTLRLAKALSAYRPDLELRIVTDDVPVFARLFPGLRPNADLQTAGGWTVIRWNRPWEGFAKRRARAVIETFACGFPDHYTRILFDPEDPAPRQIVNLEYLTAEPYAEEFHLLPSLTPVPQVRKHFFLPGFTPDTGGLILDPAYIALKHRLSDRQDTGGRDRSGERARERLRISRELGLPASVSGGRDSERFRIMLFSYPRDFTPLVETLAAWDRGVEVIAAEGQAADKFFGAWTDAGRPFPAYRIPFVSQADFDRLILTSDFLVVRGEESLARACLSGIPFVWHAYPLEDGFQRVKVEALLARLEPYMNDRSAFEPLRSLWHLFNGAPDRGAAESESWRTVLDSSGLLSRGFAGFSQNLESAGDITVRLLDFFSGFLYTAGT